MVFLNWKHILRLLSAKKPHHRRLQYHPEKCDLEKYAQLLTSRCIVIRCTSASYICVITTKSVTQTLCKQIVQNNETSLKAKWSYTNWTCVLHFTCFPRDLSVRKLGFPRSISWPQNLVGNHGGGPLLLLAAACHRPCRSCSTLYPLSSTTQRQHQVHTKGQRQRQKNKVRVTQKDKERNKQGEDGSPHDMTWHCDQVWAGVAGG